MNHFNFQSASDVCTAINRYSGYRLQMFVGSVPYHKGSAGQIIEKLIGVKPNARPEPDIPSLGLEIKTLPISSSGQVKENTFLMSIQLPLSSGSFKRSTLFHKIRHILFVPIIRAHSYASLEDWIGKAFLYDLERDLVSFKTMEQDWDMLTNLLTEEEYHFIDADLGELLHIRPKARNAQHLQRVGAMAINPLGWYLRKKHTQQLINNQAMLTTAAPIDTPNPHSSDLK